ncbi:MAG: OsmC family protein [Deltaproteobacteria bacterium]|nr:OsmC family protein [Deltaproteobacteria bacterium]
MSRQTAKRRDEHRVNGVHVDRLFDTIDAIKSEPDIAKFKFRISNKWIDGGHNHTTIKDFHGALKDHPHEQPFELAADEPGVLLGQDNGPNPVEYLLTALAGCLTSSLVYHAAARGIEVRGIESRLEGNLDLRGFLGLSKDVPVGYEEIRVFFKIDADITEQEKQELIESARKYYPVFNTVSSPTKVTIQLKGE